MSLQCWRLVNMEDGCLCLVMPSIPPCCLHSMWIDVEFLTRFNATICCHNDLCCCSQFGSWWFGYPWCFEICFVFKQFSLGFWMDIYVILYYILFYIILYYKYSCFLMILFYIILKYILSIWEYIYVSRSVCSWEWWNLKKKNVIIPLRSQHLINHHHHHHHPHHHHHHHHRHGDHDPPFII